MNKSHIKFLFVALIILLLLNIYQFAEVQRLENQVSAQSSEIHSLNGDLEDTRNKLKIVIAAGYYLNSAIQEAKNYTWGTYEDMGYALESLPQ